MRFLALSRSIPFPSPQRAPSPGSFTPKTNSFESPGLASIRPRKKIPRRATTTLPSALGRSGWGTCPMGLRTASLEKRARLKRFARIDSFWHGTILPVSQCLRDPVLQSGAGPVGERSEIRMASKCVVGKGSTQRRPDESGRRRCLGMEFCVPAEIPTPHAAA